MGSDTARDAARRRATLFYQRTSKTPDVTGLWEQWARFELMQGDAERARGLYRAALLHVRGAPRARAPRASEWAVMEFGADNRVAADGLFERALRVLDDAERAAAAAEEGLEDAEAEVREQTESQTESAASLRRAQAVARPRGRRRRARRRRGCGARVPGARHGPRPRERQGGARARAAGGASRRRPAAEALYREILRLRPGKRTLRLARASALGGARGRRRRARRVRRRRARQPENHKVLQSWAVMEAKRGGAKGVNDAFNVGKKRGDADLDVDALADKRRRGVCSSARVPRAVVGAGVVRVGGGRVPGHRRLRDGSRAVREGPGRRPHEHVVPARPRRGGGSPPAASRRRATTSSARWTSSPATGGA